MLRNKQNSLVQAVWQRICCSGQVASNDLQRQVCSTSNLSWCWQVELAAAQAEYKKADEEVLVVKQQTEQLRQAKHAAKEQKVLHLALYCIGHRYDT